MAPWAVEPDDDDADGSGLAVDAADRLSGACKPDADAGLVADEEDDDDDDDDEAGLFRPCCSEVCETERSE